MPERQEDNTQKICDTQPYCICAGKPSPGDKEKHAMECCCVASHAAECDICGAALVLINTQTGEVYTAGAWV
jgi:hypothetical protein